MTLTIAILYHKARWTYGEGILDTKSYSHPGLVWNSRAVGTKTPPKQSSGSMSLQNGESMTALVS